MIYLYTFLYYSLFTSVVLIYGIGLNKIAEIGIIKFKETIVYVKCAVAIVSSSIISWLITNYLLTPLKITELYPLICFIVYACISTFLGGLIRLTTGHITSEFAVSYLVILLSIAESSSLIFKSIKLYLDLYQKKIKKFSSNVQITLTIAYIKNE